MNPTTNTCTCGGHSRIHVVARRTTADGIGIELHSDGAVTGKLGFGLDGVPIARPRTPEATARALVAGWLFVGEVLLYETSELAALYEACRWAAARDGLPGTVRARLARAQQPVLVPHWTVDSTDRDGRPTSRYWRLPRIIAAGVVVWDHVSVGASGGRYEIMHVVPGSKGETIAPTGIRFATLGGVAAFLHRKGIPS